MKPSAPIEELVICQLTVPSDHQEFRAAVAESSRWLESQPGYLWRATGYSDDGRMIDRVGWASLAEAEAAGATFMESQAGQSLGRFLAPEGMVFLHYRPEEN